ncbi:MAG: hypothetical protein Q8M17_05330 [Actinomycetota bacterium]|nr:hypothetical protein [Actinomycetota bacterium]
MGSTYTSKQTPQELAAWAAAGFDEDEAFQWGRMDYAPEEASAWRDIGFTLNSANHCRGSGMSIDRAKEWLAAGMPPPGDRMRWDATMYDSLIEPVAAMQLRELGVNHLNRDHLAWIEHYSLDEFARLAVDWANRGGKVTVSSRLLQTMLTADQILAAFDAGFGDYAVEEWFDHFGWALPVWLSWRDAGFAAKDAGILSKGFANPQQVEPWVEAGFSYLSATGYAQRGVTLDQACAFRGEGILARDLTAEGFLREDRPVLLWSHAFSRSRGASHVYAFKANADEAILQRVFMALANLQAVNNSSGVSMYSSISECHAFLDGGVYYSSPYGFGGLRGTWVFGDLSLALLCDRAGLKRPRTPRQPSRDDLNQAWDWQRTSQVSELEQRAAAALGTQWLVQLDDLVSPTPMPHS